MPKQRRWWLDYGLYVVLRLVGCILLAMPLEAALWLIRVLASIACAVDHRHRQVALENLRQSFPGVYTEEQLHQLTAGVYQHFGIMLLELLLIPRRMGSRRWREELVETFSPELRQALDSGRPILITTAHYGNWELTAFILRFYGKIAHIVARPMDNPFLDDMMTRFRECLGHKVLSKHGDLARMREILAAGGTLCTLADQSAGHRGLFVDFFGRPASTHKVIAYLARRTRALVLVGGAQSLGKPLKYTVRTTDIIDPDDYAKHPDPVFAITQRMTHAVEKLIRFDPRQYLWLHQRWKYRPPVAKSAAA
ncbi:MAG: lysophospholipid acyltransferase family protein [Planctomycetes bacterium]|nr:lysophospholipid acyltransferase family protein [Planctomycetota bacterium]